MIFALSVVSAIALILLYAVWMRHREAGQIAWKATEFLQDRIRKLDEERGILLTRIQLWEAKPTVEDAKAAKLSGIQHPVDDIQPETPDDDMQLQMQRRGLRANSDGGYLDEHGRIFWTFQAFDEWEAFRQNNRLPGDADPRDFTKA